MLFAEVSEIKKFKILKNATAQDLEAALQEVTCIIETGTADVFLALFYGIQMAKNVGATIAQKIYNIAGLSASLLFVETTPFKIFFLFKYRKNDSNPNLFCL